MAQLRILLGNNTLSLLAGSETWTRTLAVGLKDAGCHVEAFSPDLGIIAQQLIRHRIPCHNEMSSGKIKPFSTVLERVSSGEFDVIIANHCHIVEYLRAAFPKTPIISTVHGIIHEFEGQRAPEHPALEAGVNQFVSVSEEVQNILKVKYGLDSKLIRNFLDIRQFDGIRPVSDGKPHVIVFNSNYHDSNSPEIAVLREVANHYGAKLGAIGANFAFSDNIRATLEPADIVVGMGRSVLEGVAAGRLGIVHGRWGTGGVIEESSVERLRAVNFSGRDSGGAYWDAQRFIEEIDRAYNPATIAWGVDYIKREHNVVHAVDEFLGLARMLTGQKAPDPDGRRRIPLKKAF